jgi:hypothetical protein
MKAWRFSADNHMGVATDVSQSHSQRRHRARSRTFLALAFEVLASVACLAAYAPGGPLSQTAARGAEAPPATPTPRAMSVSWLDLGLAALDSAVPEPSPTPTPSETPALGTWELDLYDARGVRYQNPDMTACTAAAAQMMLNMAVYWPDYTPLTADQPVPLKPDSWKPSVTFGRQELVLGYERGHMTTPSYLDGADPHGWRNALNYFGWGSIRAGVYRDVPLRSLDAAAHSVVSAIALYRKPVGILAWQGRHAQLVTGYRVEGEDPRTGSTNFKVVGVYLTDPLSAYQYRDRFVSLQTWRSGRYSLEFQPFVVSHQTRLDPIDHVLGDVEWNHRWVIIAPVM